MNYLGARFRRREKEEGKPSYYAYYEQEVEHSIKVHLYTCDECNDYTDRNVAFKQEKRILCDNCKKKIAKEQAKKREDNLFRKKLEDCVFQMLKENESEEYKKALHDLLERFS